MAKVELQETAKAFSGLVEPYCSLASLWKTRPSTVIWLGHCTVLDGVMPLAASADPVTILKVEPGGKMPDSARSNPPGRSTTASTWPVDGWSATTSTGLLVEAACTALDAAIWSCMLMLVCTGVPGTAGKVAAVESTRLAGPSTLMASDGCHAR